MIVTYKQSWIAVIKEHASEILTLSGSIGIAFIVLKFSSYGNEFVRI